MSWLTRADYSLDEVAALVSTYSEIRFAKHRPMIFVRLCDLERCLRLLPHQDYLAILLVGMLDVPVREAAVHLNLAKSTLWDHYLAALERLTALMNGDTL